MGKMNKWLRVFLRRSTPDSSGVVNLAAGGSGKGHRMVAFLYYCEKLRLEEVLSMVGDYKHWYTRGSASRDRTGYDSEDGRQKKVVFDCNVPLKLSLLPVLVNVDDSVVVRGCVLNGRRYQVAVKDSGMSGGDTLYYIVGEIDSDEGLNVEERVVRLA